MPLFFSILRVVCQYNALVCLLLCYIEYIESNRVDDVEVIAYGNRIKMIKVEFVSYISKYIIQIL